MRRHIELTGGMLRDLMKKSYMAGYEGVPEIMDEEIDQILNEYVQKEKDKQEDKGDKKREKPSGWSYSGQEKEV